LAVTPVIAGLAVGIALVVLFASIFTSSSPVLIGRPLNGDIEGKTYCPSSRFQLSNLLIQDENGGTVNKTSVGSTVNLSANIHSNCEISNYRVAVGFLATKKGIPSLITISSENITLSNGSDMKLHATWKPEESASFLVGVVAAACYRCSGDYGIYQQMNLTVTVGDADNSAQIDCQQSGLCTYYLEEGDTTYSINYRFNGTIQKMTANATTQTLWIDLNAPTTGNFEIAIPRAVVDPRDGADGNDADFAVFADEENVAANEYSTKDSKWAEELGITDNPEKYRILVIPLTEGTELVEIVGTFPI
jgi:hypothetical protein